MLKETLQKLCPDKVLTSDERRRNSRGKVYCYMYDAAVNDTVPSFNRDIGIKDIAKCKSKVHILDEPSIEPTSSFKPILIPGTRIPYPGFPSLNVLPMTSAELRPISVNCFGTGSKYSTTILTLQTLPTLPGAAQLADNILGKHLYINWPMMHEAKVVAVSDEHCTVRIVKKQSKVTEHSPKEAQKWVEESELMNQSYLQGYGQPGSGGVEIGPVQIRLKLVSLQGMKVSPVNGSSKKIFGTEEADVPLQMVLWQSPAPDPRFEERGPMTLKDRFPPQSRVVLTKGKHRGSVGTILSVVDDKVGVKVEVAPHEPPFGLAIARTVQESYLSTMEASKALKMNPGIFAKVTGSLFFQPGNYDIGLNLKYKKDYCVLGYTRRRNKDGTNVEKKSNKAWGSNDTVLLIGSKRNESIEDDKNAIWEYTPKAVKLVAAFRQKFPKLFFEISKSPSEKKYEAKILGPKGTDELKLIRDWLNNVETAKVPRTPCTTEEMPREAISAVQRAADVRVAESEKENVTKHVNLKIPSGALYLEGSTLPTDVIYHSDGDSPELGDRVVNLCANGLPFGERGTVVGIHHESTGCVEVVMDKEFIGGSTLQGSCSNFRGKLCVWNHLLKVNASNSKDIVDQMIPTGSGKATIDKILQTSDLGISAEIENGRNDNQKDQEKIEKAKEIPNAWKQPSPARSRGGKQGAWREAAGPSEKGNGFKGAGRGKNGLNAWKKIVASNGPSGAPKDTSAGLKAILGVKNEKPQQATSNASVGLKNLLGISPTRPKAETKSNQEMSKGPVSAADALMQLMAQAPAKTEQSTFHPQQSAFNFTYVKEGEAKPPVPPAQPINHPQMLYHQGQMGIFPPPVPPNMLYPNMMPHQMPMGQPFHVNINNKAANDAPIPARDKKDKVGIEESPLIPSITLKAKK